MHKPGFIPHQSAWFQEPTNPRHRVHGAFDKGHAFVCGVPVTYDYFTQRLFEQVLRLNGVNEGLKTLFGSLLGLNDLLFMLLRTTEGIQCRFKRKLFVTPDRLLDLRSSNQ